MKKYAIIVAGGSGTRFGSTLPKQFVPLGGVLFLPIKGLSLHPGVKTLPPEEERVGAYCLGIGGKRLAVEG